MADATIISERNRRYHAANRDRLLARQAEHRRARKAGPDSVQWALKKLVSDADRRARDRGLPFGITPADLETPLHCPLLGLPLIYQATGRRVAASASIDRISSSGGYTKGNVWIVSWRANQIKSDATPDELRRIAEALDRKAAAGRLLDGVEHNGFPEVQR